MMRFLAALLAATIVSGARGVAADESAVPPRAAGSGPFEHVLLPHPPPRSHLGSNLAFLTGAGMIAGSFTLAHRADQAYDRYRAASAPTDIEHWFDESAHYDRWSNGALLGGEALIGVGIYLRFLHRPAAAVTLHVAPRSCAVSLRF